MKNEKRKIRLSRSLIIDLISYVAVFCITFFALNMFFTLTNATSGSMYPTIKTHDLMMSNRLAYQKKEPQRGDIITFSTIDENGKDALFGKRVIGVPGDVVSFHDGYVYINDEKLDESDYLDEDVETNCIETFTVPDQCVFVLGDNREDSYDSRYWENPYVSYDQIVAKVVLVIPTHVFYSDED